MTRIALVFVGLDTYKLIRRDLKKCAHSGTGAIKKQGAGAQKRGSGDVNKVPRRMINDVFTPRDANRTRRQLQVAPGVSMNNLPRAFRTNIGEEGRFKIPIDSLSLSLYPRTECYLL